eukprot:340535-Hanusia_phi.AAC.1
MPGPDPDKRLAPLSQLDVSPSKGQEEAEPTKPFLRKSAFARSISLCGSSFSRSSMQAKAKLNEAYTFPSMAVTRPNRTASVQSSDSDGNARNGPGNAMEEDVYWPYYNCFCGLEDVELDKLKSDSLAFRDFLLSKPGGKYKVNAGILRHGRAERQEQDVVVVGIEGKSVRLVDIRDACVAIQKIPFVPKVTYSRWAAASQGCGSTRRQGASRSSSPTETCSQGLRAWSRCRAQPPASRARAPRSSGREVTLLLSHELAAAKRKYKQSRKILKGCTSSATVPRILTCRHHSTREEYTSAMAIFQTLKEALDLQKQQKVDDVGDLRLQVEEARAHLQRLKRALVRKGISCRQLVEGVETVDEGSVASSSSPSSYLAGAAPAPPAAAAPRVHDDLASLFEMAKAGGHIVET